MSEPKNEPKKDYLWALLNDPLVRKMHKEGKSPKQIIIAMAERNQNMNEIIDHLTAQI